MLKEFREFILKGNAIDLAVGVLIGAAFGKVVEAFSKGIVEPLLNQIGGKPDVALKLWIFDVGTVLTALISLLVTGAVLFFIFVKPMNRLKTMFEKPAAPAGPPELPADVKLLAEIRDLLKNRS